VSLLARASSASDHIHDHLEPRVAGVNLKMYFGLQETYRWLESVADLCSSSMLASATQLEMFVMPTFPALDRAVEILAGTGIAVGAQNAAAASSGAQTGEVSAATLAELGCRYLLVGHAERRDGFHEDDRVVARKVRQAEAVGLIPVLCIGERDHVSPDEALAVCLRQIGAARGSSADAPIVIAYEPVWAIGAAHAAPPEHVRRVCAALRDPNVTGLERARVVYGGAAGVRTFEALTPTVDGLFLGRFAHDPHRFRVIAAEIAGPQPGQAAAAFLEGRLTK
jgi:triosephosphate isomerase